MVLPDYHTAGIANLMGSIRRALGASGGVPPLPALPPEQLTASRHLALVVLDGLGYDYLLTHSDGVLRQHLHGSLTSVFPSATAAAITTFATAVPPAQHAATGWFMYLAELGTVAVTLPFHARWGGPSFSAAGIDARALFHLPSLGGEIDRSSVYIAPEQIVHSDFSRASTAGARRLGYQDLTGFTEQIANTLTASPDPLYLYAYWPRLDGLTHEHGVTSPTVATHFRELEATVSELMANLRGTDTTLVITADHGLIDIGPGQAIHLDDHPALAEHLALPLCGEPRVAYCYLRPGHEQAFMDYIDAHLAHTCQAIPSHQLIEQGYFGPGPVHPRLAQRIGDITLIMREGYVIKDFLLSEERRLPTAVHGGLSAQEMQVPLIVTRL